MPVKVANNNNFKQSKKMCNAKAQDQIYFAQLPQSSLKILDQSYLMNFDCKMSALRPFIAVQIKLCKVN